MAEVALFFEKVLVAENEGKADFIEGVAAGIGGAFGGMKELKPMICELRGGNRNGG